MPPHSRWQPHNARSARDERTQQAIVLCGLVLSVAFTLALVAWLIAGAAALFRYAVGA